MPSTIKKKYTYAVGRRRSAVVTVKLFSGTSVPEINGKSLEKYFPGDLARNIYNLPQEVTKTAQKFYFIAKAIGGGKVGQLKALALAISRALLKTDPDFRLPLRQAGLLTVDSRQRQRRMVGTGGKARRQKQSPKR